jgi:antitoxin component of RelBE/YafQ-DinJ toxin-antitoxin module
MPTNPVKIFCKQDGGRKMPQITITLPEQDMAKATAVVAQKGLSLAEAISLEVNRIAVQETFEIPHIPNKKTAEALDRSERGEGVYTAEDKEDLFRHLGLDKW